MFIKIEHYILVGFGIFWYIALEVSKIPPVDGDILVLLNIDQTILHFIPVVAVVLGLLTGSVLTPPTKLPISLPALPILSSHAVTSLPPMIRTLLPALTTALAERLGLAEFPSALPTITPTPPPSAAPPPGAPALSEPVVIGPASPGTVWKT